MKECVPTFSNSVMLNTRFRVALDVIYINHCYQYYGVITLGNNICISFFYWKSFKRFGHYINLNQRSGNCHVLSSAVQRVTITDVLAGSNLTLRS